MIAECMTSLAGWLLQIGTIQLPFGITILDMSVGCVGLYVIIAWMYRFFAGGSCER